MNEQDRDLYLKEMAAAAERTANALERIESAQDKWIETQRYQLASLHEQLKVGNVQTSWTFIGVGCILALLAMWAYKMN